MNAIQPNRQGIEHHQAWQRSIAGTAGGLSATRQGSASFPAVYFSEVAPMSTASAPSSFPGSGGLLPTTLTGRALLHHEFSHLRKHWWWLLALGILLVVCGTVAVVVPPIATLAAINVLAIVFLIAGVATIISSFWAGRWSGLLVNLLVGILYVVAGFVITEKPFQAIDVLTLFIAIWFIVTGVFRTLAAMLIRFPQWGWALLNGVVTMLLGIYIYRHYPVSAFWVLGLLVGVELLLSGWTWIMLAFAIRSIPEETTT
jgi:uncharacterized membrane protein HdeD (DUF308 family)